jgi:hypothetical protein
MQNGNSLFRNTGLWDKSTPVASGFLWRITRREENIIHFLEMTNLRLSELTSGSQDLMGSEFEFRSKPQR